MGITTVEQARQAFLMLVSGGSSEWNTVVHALEQAERWGASAGRQAANRASITRDAAIAGIARGVGR